MIVLEETEVLTRVQNWAEATPSVRAAILTSSRVNPEPSVDQYSDYDIVVYVNDWSQFWDNDEWMSPYFGEVLVRMPWKPGSTNEGWLTRLVVFKDGFRIDFQINEGALDASHFVDGYRVLIDKDGITDSLAPPTYEGYLVRKPTKEFWESFTNEFWWEIVYVAKALARDELFYARFMLDTQIRLVYLRKLIEWSICVNLGWSTQPNKYGRHFKRLVTPERWEVIESTYVGANIEENWQALENVLALFRELSQEVAEHFGYPYPKKVDQEVSQYMVSMRKAQTFRTDRLDT